jgi:hypothetical protein
MVVSHWEHCHHCISHFAELVVFKGLTAISFRAFSTCRFSPSRSLGFGLYEDNIRYFLEKQYFAQVSDSTPKRFKQSGNGDNCRGAATGQSRPEGT